MWGSLFCYRCRSWGFGLSHLSFRIHWSEGGEAWGTHKRGLGCGVRGDGRGQQGALLRASQNTQVVWVVLVGSGEPPAACLEGVDTLLRLHRDPYSTAVCLGSTANAQCPPTAHSPAQNLLGFLVAAGSFPSCVQTPAATWKRDHKAPGSRRERVRALVRCRGPHSGSTGVADGV